MARRPRVLLVAPDFRCATGVTPLLVARHGRRFRHTLFAARDLRFRRRSFDRLISAADLVHWHVNLAHFTEAAEVAERHRGQSLQVATVHHLDPDDGYLQQAARAVADHLHVPSATTAAAVGSAGDDGPVHVVPYVVEQAPRPARPRPADGHLVVGWCGTTTAPDDRKRLGTLTAALARLVPLRPVLALQGWIDPSVIAAAEGAGVTVRVQPPRPWPQRWAFYDEIDLYCSPSAVEGGPLTVFEATSAGLPVVTSPTGMAAALLDAGAAWPGDPDDADALAAGIEAAAAATTEEREERHRRGQAVTATFSGPAGADRYESLYAELLGVDPVRRRRPALQPRLEAARGALRAPTQRWRTARIVTHRWRHGPDSSPYPYRVGGDQAAGASETSSATRR